MILYIFGLSSRNIYGQINDQYAQFVFTNLFLMEQLLKELEIVLAPRTLGYIGGVLTSAFISYKKENGTKVKTQNMLVITDLILMQ